MIESLSPLSTLYKMLYTGFQSNKSKIGKNARIQRKIVQTKLLLDDIIENAEGILDFVSTSLKKSIALDEERVSHLRGMGRIQKAIILELLLNLRDKTYEMILKKFNPDIRKEIEFLIHIEGGRIENLVYLLDNLDMSQLKKLYTESQLKEGKKRMKDLKKWSTNLSNFIMDNINLDKVVLQSKRTRKTKSTTKK